MKNTNQTFEKLKKIIKNLDVETTNLTLDTKLNGIIDSMEVVEICMAIEQETNSIIADKEFENWKTISDIVDTFNSKL